MHDIRAIRENPAAFDAADGTVLWSHDLREEYKIRMPNWGIAASPIIEGSLLIAQIGGQDACVVALDRRTGEQRWTALTDDAAVQQACLTPLAYTIGTDFKVADIRTDDLNLGVIDVAHVGHLDQLRGLGLATAHLTVQVGAADTFALEDRETDTDTAATLRANEMSCEAIFKGTKVDGVYDKDPKKHADAKRFDRVSYDEVLQKRLGVMDASAIALARDNKLPIIVFSLDEPGGFRGILAGEGTYTKVEG